MYLRFKTSFPDGYGEKRYGVFQAASFLLHNDTMYEHDQQRLEEVWQWFRRNLRAPDVYRRKGRTEHIICWFRPSANEHLQKMYEMIDILEDYDFAVWPVKCRKPGYIVYEDDNQVAVVPFTKLVGRVR